MKILAIEKEQKIVDWANESETLEREAREVYRQIKGGYIREIYFTDKNNAVLILECESMSKAVELLYALPLVSKGLISFEFMELKPYNGFDRIIKTEK